MVSQVVKEIIVTLCHKAKSQNGFSLIELLIVISIMSLMMTLGVQNLSGTHKKLVFEQEASKIRRLLIQGRNRSLTKRETVVARFDFDSAQLTITASTNNSPKDSFIHKLPSGMKFVQKANNTTNNNQRLELFFFQDGQSSGGQVELVSSNFSKLIDVNWLSGRVELVK